MTSLNLSSQNPTEPGPPPSLSFERVTFNRFGHRLFGPCSFTLDGPGPTLVMGPNGAGKSLMLRLAHGLLTPSEGAVTWSGSQMPRQAMVFQTPVLLRRSTLANLTHALAVNKVTSSVRNEMAQQALARFGLSASAHTPARVLSGGEKQRLALARAWAISPAVLFLDEPTSALDPAAIKAVETAVQEFHNRGTRIVMTTHDLHQARRLAGDVLFLADGNVREHTPAERFFKSPASHQARAFVSGDLVT